MKDLDKVSKEIRKILDKRRKLISLTFVEENHVYFMKDLEGNIRTDYPSVSSVMKKFYDEFPANKVALRMSNGDENKKEKLLEAWDLKSRYSANMGSRVHYYLEKEAINLFGKYKEVRQPLFECNFEQVLNGDSMISAGSNYLKLMIERGAVLLDTEIVLGDPEIGYTGQPDKVWLIKNKEDEIGLIITDWKTNDKKSFEVQSYTTKMRSPFSSLPNNALGHYFLQLPLYGKLITKMLEGSKYENLKIFGCIIVHLKKDGTFEEYRIPKEIINTVLNLKIFN